MFEKMIETQTKKQGHKLERWMKKHDSEHPFPDDVVLHENIDYIGDGKACHMMDVYIQNKNEKETGKPLPVLINIHGGGFLLGKKEVNRLFCADMCQRGFAVFCLEYPLVPEVNIFEIFRDLTAGINNVAGLAEKFGGNPERIYLCGDSAGAYLCVYLAAMQRNPDMAKVAKVPKIVPEVKALGLISGMFYIHKPDNIGFFMPKLVYGKNWKKEPFAPYTDPENPGIAGKGNLPPCFILTAKGDFLRHYSKNFAKALKKNGCEHTLLDIKGEQKLPHAFSAMFPELPDSQAANEAMAEFLLKH